MSDIQLDVGISILSENAIGHSKAAEEYIEVSLPFDGGSWSLFIPIVYRRNGLFLEYPGADCIDDEENRDSRNRLYDYLNKAANDIPKTSVELDAWKAEQYEWWESEHGNAAETALFFNALVDNVGNWMCCHCMNPENDNPQRRIQAIKDYGYTLATKTKHRCNKCNKNRTHLMMIPIARNGVGNGYEQWSDELRKRIIKVLGGIDVCDNKRNAHVLPDHKFPEIRWDKNTIANNPDDMPEEDIRKKFQLMTNQHNEEKREACRKCRLTRKRPYPFGIKYYYQGTEDWSGPQQGKDAEDGCKGCCWYDFVEWRKQVNNTLEKLSE